MSVSRFCVCKDPTGKRLKDACPRLRNRNHGKWLLALRIPTTRRHATQLKRTYATRAEAVAAGEHITDLLRLAGHDPDLKRRIGDLIFDRSRRNGPLPPVDEVRRKLGAGVDPTAPTQTVAEWLREVLASRRDLRSSTRSTAESHLRAWLVPNLGDVPLDRLRATHILDLLDFIEERNEVIRRARAEGRPVPPDPRDGRPNSRVTGPAMQRRIFGTLRAALNVAVKRRLIDRNPCAGVTLPAERRAARRVWGHGQVAAFLDHAREDPLFPLFRLVLVCGLRRGEVCGLRWSDVDLDAGKLTIAQTLLQLGGSVTYGTPKTRAGDREVWLDPDTLAILRGHRLRHGFSRSGLVFTEEDGSPLPPKRALHRFKYLAAEAGLPVIVLHEGRHTAATLALEAGLDVKIVSTQLGHASTNTTRDIYQHVRPEVAREAAERVARLIPTKREA